jgi:sortase A
MEAGEEAMRYGGRRIVVGLVFAGLVAGTWACGSGSDPVADVPVRAKRATTTVPAPTTSVLPAQSTRPVDVPKDPYAPEPVRLIGRMQIPKIGLDHEVFEGITMNNIDHGPSHWPGSAVPGQVGNAVFSGHRITHSHPFRRIDELAVGDSVIFEIGGTRSTYRVIGDEIVTPRDMWIANPSPLPTATLFACHPPGSKRFRYVVHLALWSSAPVSSSAAPPGSM